jgi:type II secretory pathway pseudopilin PulG
MRQVGTTLIELSVVVLILAVVAAAVVRSQTSADAAPTLDAAAEEVAAALRFARSEAIRTAEPYGVDRVPGSQVLRVYRYPPGGPVDYTIRHPVDQRLYHLDFDADPMLNPVSVTAVAFYYEGEGFPTSFCGFLAGTGTPKKSVPPNTLMLTAGSITLAAGGETRVVSVAPMTGRVTIQ